MTPYERGFLTKCAEHGVPRDVAHGMLKQALVNLPSWLRWANPVIPMETNVDREKREAAVAAAKADTSREAHPYNVGRAMFAQPRVPVANYSGAQSNALERIGRRALDSNPFVRAKFSPAPGGREYATIVNTDPKAPSPYHGIGTQFRYNVLHPPADIDGSVSTVGSGGHTGSTL